MNRVSLSIVGLMLAAASFSAGCTAQKAPFKFQTDGDVAHYDKVATEIEYPNIADCPSDAAINCPSPEVIGPDSQPTYWDLKLEEAMQMGLAKSKVLHDLGGTVLQRPVNARTIADPSIVDTDPQFGVEAALSQFDATFNSKVDYQRNDRLLNNVFFGGGTRDLLQDTDVFHSDITKTAATGSQFTFAHNTVYDHNNSPGNLFGSSWDTNFEASVRQPLLQGAGVEYNRIAGPKGSPGNLQGVLLARVNTDISLADFEIGLRDLVSNIENAYWDLYFAYRDLDAKITARDNALESWRKTHALFLAGRRGGEAEKEAEAREQYFHFQEDVQNAWSGRLTDGTQSNNGSGGGTLRASGGVRVCERRLRFLIGLPASDGRLIRPSDEPSLAKIVFNWDEVLPEAINRRPELRRQRWVVKRGELTLLASKNFLLPKLDTFGLYRLRGFGHDLKDGGTLASEDSAFADLTSGQHQEWEFGAEFSMPLGERQGHATVRNAQLVLSRERAVLEDQEREAVSDVSNAVAEVDRAYSVAQTTFNRRMAAKADLASTKAAYDSDKAPLDLYLEAQRRSADAESNFFATLVEYALAIKNLHYAKGSLLDYNEVYLSEGPWPGKAYQDAANRQPSRWQPHALNYIFHQTTPVSIGTEPNYRVPPPVGPLPGPPVGPGEAPSHPEEIPTVPSSQPPTGSSPTTDKRAAPSASTLRAATAQPSAPPEQTPRWTIPVAPQQSATQPIKLNSAGITAPPPANRPAQVNSAPPANNATQFYNAPPTNSAPPTNNAPMANGTPTMASSATPNNALRAADSARYQPSLAPAPAPTPVPYPTPSQVSVVRRAARPDDAPPADSQRPNNSPPSNLNWVSPQDKSAAVDRWSIPVAPSPASPPPANRDSGLRSAQSEPPHESIFVSEARAPRENASPNFQSQPPSGPPAQARFTIPSDTTLQRLPPVPTDSTANVPAVRRLPPIAAQPVASQPLTSQPLASQPAAPQPVTNGRPEPSQSASWPESAVRSLPPVGNSNTYYAAPAPQGNNYLRPSPYSTDSGSNAQGWPAANDRRPLPPVQPTSYLSALGDSQQPAAMQPMPTAPPTRPLPPTSSFQPLPPTSSFQPLPPTSQIQPLPPLGQ